MADVYTVYDRVLQLGVQMLYQDTKDISLLRKELAKRNSEDEKKKRELFEFKANRDKEQRQVRKELEKAYDAEKSKVSTHQVH